jgi:hypothetical protein
MDDDFRRLSVQFGGKDDSLTFIRIDPSTVLGSLSNSEDVIVFLFGYTHIYTSHHTLT